MVIIRGQLSRRQLPGDNFSRGRCLGGNYPGGNYPEEQLSGGQLSWGAIVRGGNCPGGNSPRTEIKTTFLLFVFNIKLKIPDEQFLFFSVLLKFPS